MPAKRGGLSGAIMGIVGVVVLVAVLIGVGVAYEVVVNPNHDGQILFTTSTADSMTDNCKISNTVTTVKLGDPVYANYFLKHQVSVDATVNVTKDGQYFGSIDLTAAEITGYDCLAGTHDMSEDLTEAGNYKFTLETSGGETLAEGTLTVTA